MGAHKPGLVPVGAFVEIGLRDYLDNLVEERGLLTRSDAVRIVIDEHRTIFNDRINRNQALTPLEVNVNDNLQGGGLKMKLKV